MNVRTVTRGAEAACSVCGNDQVRSVCHHCGRPLCAEHHGLDLDADGRPRTIEMTGLEIVGTRHGEAPVHCDECRHTLRRPPWALLAGGGAAIVAGRLIQQEMPAAGLAVVLAGVVTALVAGALIWTRLRALRSLSVPVPLSPRFGKVVATERIEGTMTMTADGDWTSRVTGRSGEIAVHATFGEPERRVLDAYRHRSGASRTPRDLDFSAGFLLLRQRVLGQLDGEAAAGRGGALVVPLSGAIGDVPFLASHEGRGDRTWEMRWGYRILDDGTAWRRGESSDTGEREKLPIRVIPSLVPDSDGRALELELRWSEPRADGVGGVGAGGPDQEKDRAPGAVLDRPRIEELVVDVPRTWGEVAHLSVVGSEGGVATEGNASPPGAATLPDQASGPVRRIRWQGVGLECDEAGTGRARLRLQFDHWVDPGAVLRGTVTVGFHGGVSGLRAIDLFDPLGGLRSQDVADVCTRMTARFDLGLGVLRHRTLRVLSTLEDRRASERDEGAGNGGQSLDVPGVAPDHAFVLRLARELRQARFFIQRIEEEPARVGSHARRTSRLWDLSGQFRTDLHVFEVHLIVGGEEEVGDAGPDGSFTRVSATLRGTVSDAVSEARLSDAWETLREAVKTTVAAARRGLGDPDRADGVALGAVEAAPRLDPEPESELAADAQLGREN